jgi:hypothetical protein
VRRSLSIAATGATYSRSLRAVQATICTGRLHWVGTGDKRLANLVASTSGADSDWEVKLIDVYPDDVGGYAVMGGFQLMIAADIDANREQRRALRGVDRRRDAGRGGVRWVRCKSGLLVTAFARRC